MLSVLAACSRNDAPPTAAQEAPKSQPAATATPSTQAGTLPSLPFSTFDATEPGGPAWNQLTAEQRKVLAPLAGEWNRLPTINKKKWLEISAKYAQMSPAEQQRIQARMREWAQLTPEQRRIARENYARAKKLGPDQKSAKWERYQHLPAEEKEKLAANAEKKKNVVNLPRTQPTLPPVPAAKPAAPVLPSTPTTVTINSAPPPTTAPVTVPAGNSGDISGDPLSAPAR